MMAARREHAPHGMPYCPTHNRLFPHPFVSWLTPRGTTGLALVPARCDWCIKERGDEVLSYSFQWVTTLIPEGVPTTHEDGPEASRR